MRPGDLSGASRRGHPHRCAFDPVIVVRICASIAARWLALAGTDMRSGVTCCVGESGTGTTALGAALLSRLAAVTPPRCGPSGRTGSRRSRVVRNAPGRSIRSGHDQPRARMSALSAAVIPRAVQASRSRPERARASQMCPVCTAPRPWQLATTPAASCCSCSGLGA